MITLQQRKHSLFLNIARYKKYELGGKTNGHPES